MKKNTISRDVEALICWRDSCALDWDGEELVLHVLSVLRSQLSVNDVPEEHRAGFLEFQAMDQDAQFDAVSSILMLGSGMECELLQLLRNRSLKRAAPGEFFTLASGAKSDVYLDVRKTALDPRGHVLLGEALFNVAAAWVPEVDLVAGVALGGCPLASAVSMHSGICFRDWSTDAPIPAIFLPGKPYPAVYVRKEAKAHGSASLVEGSYTAGQSVLLLEDVVTSGGSSLKAFEALKSAGLNPVGIVAVVNREQGGDQLFASAGIKFEALYTMREILDEG